MVLIWHPNIHYSNWQKRSQDFVFVAVNLWGGGGNQEIKNSDTPITVDWGSRLLILFFDFNSGGRPNLSSHCKLLSKTSLFSRMIFPVGKVCVQCETTLTTDGMVAQFPPWMIKCSSSAVRVISLRTRLWSMADITLNPTVNYTQLNLGNFENCYLLTLFADFLWDEFHGCAAAGKAICVAVSSVVQVGNG